MPAKKVTKPAKTVKKAKKAVVSKPKETGLKLSVYDVSGKSVGKIDLPKEIFGAAVNERLLAQAIRVYLANKRQGTVSTKTRGEVVGSSRKIYRQKGTGRARHGSVRAPIFVKGGLVFGPKPRDYGLKLPQKMRKAALFQALSAKLKDGEIKVVSGFEKIEPKTKIVADSLKKIDSERKTLLVTTGKAENVYRAGRNIRDVEILPANMLNAYTVLNNHSVVFMKESVEVLKENFLKEGKNEQV